MIDEIDSIKRYVEENGRLINRNHGSSREILSYSIKLNPENYVSFRIKEYNEYYKMIANQIPIALTEYSKNKFSRRLLFQFDRFYYEDRVEDYLICPESFIIFFINDNDYELVINLRSTDIDRLSEDVSIIKHITQGIFEEKNLSLIRVHICNLHCYIL